MTTDIDIIIGVNIKRRRKELNIKQGLMANLLGISRPCLSLHEYGKRKVPSNRLVHISKLFGVPMSYFYDGRLENND